MNLVGHVLEVQRVLGVHLSVQQLDKIYDKCKESVVRSHDRRLADRSRNVRTTSSKATSVAAPSAGSVSLSYVTTDPRLLDQETLTAGVHRGRSYNEVYVGEVPYTKTTLKDPELVKYAETQRSARSSQ